METLKVGKNSEKNKKRFCVRRKALCYSTSFVFLFVIFFGVLVWSNFSKVSQESIVNVEELEVRSDEVKKIVQKAEKENGDLGEDEQISSSENFIVDQLVLTNDVVLKDGGADEDPLIVSHVRSEVVVSEEDGKPKILVNWRTNKESVGEVVYVNNDNDKVKSYKENSYGMDHSALLGDVDLSSIYVYHINAIDRWGNETNSEFFSVYTGDRAESIIDLIMDSFGDVFGWMSG
jgi:hypothetical protein